MFEKNDDDHTLTQPNLVFLLAIAGRIDAQSRILAQNLEKDRKIYYAYAALDSLSSSYSMFKYFFDVFIATNDSDKMHDMMMTPGGIIAIAAESIFLVSFSVLACMFENEKKDEIKKFIATAWPYFRDVMKGLKNAYKGWRSAIQATNVISGLNLNYLIVPIGLVLGILAAANRFWLRSMVEARKVLMKKNTEYLLDINERTILHYQDRKYFLDRLEEQLVQVNQKHKTSFAAVALGGLIDGLYLYVGVLSLAALSNPVFTAMAVFCSIYTLACVITRVYEEYDFQMRLLIIQSKCKLLLINKELNTLYSELILMKNEPGYNQLDFANLQNNICSLIKEYEELHAILNSQTSRSYLGAGLMGMKNGLYAYSALASILFLISTILMMASTTFPPVLLIIGVSLGLALMIGFLSHSLYSQYLLNQKSADEEQPLEKIHEMKEHLETNKEEAELINEADFKTSLDKGLTVKPARQYFFQEWFEVVRSFFSGLGKGQKFIDFSCNPLQEMDESGHYHDTPVMYVLAILSAALFSITLALRALARGLGREPLGQVTLNTTNAATPGAPAEETISSNNAEVTTDIPLNIIPKGPEKISSEPEKNGADFTWRLNKPLARSKSGSGLFFDKIKPEGTLSHSVSDSSFSFTN